MSKWMVTNERQYRVFRSQAEQFEQSLAELDCETQDLDPELRELHRDSLRSMLETFREEIALYEALRDGKLDVIEIASLRELPDGLIQARIATGATQKELAQRLGLREQQIQRYEANRYEGASLRRLRQVAEALGVGTPGRIVLPGRDGVKEGGNRSIQGAMKQRPRTVG